MATILQAVNIHGAKIGLNPTAQLKQVAEWTAMRIGLNKSEIMMVLQELSEAILNYNKGSTPIKLPGIGTFTPSVNREGEFKVNFRVDNALRNGINAPDAYTGAIRNKHSAGLDNAGHKELWDANHPDDPLDVHRQEHGCSEQPCS